jgi:hypothetical protein
MEVAMSPLLRLWAWFAVAAAALLALRGAIAPALALFLCSPAPVLVLARGGPDQGSLSRSWLAGLVLLAALGVGLVVLIVALGGIPPLHEWPARLRRS